ncbi:histidine kinase N-terminal 7TM domain-containing protein [Haloarcula onubensis]|uniref:histidine kinase n=1 Tax=Haloarcula onubensis TaxID=2950539 RepID=A0ABU2FN00_9EURY|nr:histidine kinase N-terminal 7TM domain-containing protein [Halomicroarcula sp. S3CR25-11]MDS0282140.1 ATP-binding protein [Halomicroarcula sp. S3CR25-11]
MVGEPVLSVVVAAFLLVAALASYGFAWYSWRRAEHPISDRFALLMTADGSWALFSLLGHVSPTDELALLFRVPFTAGAAVLAVVFWFLFVIEYTTDSDWIPSVVVRGFVVLAAGYITLLVVDPVGPVYRSVGVARYGLLRVPYGEFGTLALGYLAVTYAVLLFSFALLGRFLLQTRNLFRKQAAAIFTVTFAVMVSTVLFVAELSPHPQLDLTPALFAVQAVGVGVALYRYDFLDVEPMAAHTLLEEMADPVFVVDSRDRLVDWNDAADAYVDGGGRATLADIAIPDLTRTLTSTDGGAGSNTATVTAARPDGNRGPVTYDVRTTSIADRYGIVRGRAVVLRDVTEQEQRKRALETQNERLEEFTGVVSHDLRNPLQVIDNRLELARQTGDLSHLDDASEATRRMEVLLDDLLELAREGRVLDQTEAVDLAARVADAWASLDAPEATLSVETDRTVVADPSRLQQVFENLFRNAVEHGSTGNRTQSDDAVDHGSPGVSITVGDTDDGFYVADDGPGIPPEERDSVFELGVTNADDGTGFGLAIVKRVIDAHGWAIAVTESERGGARFDVTLSERPLPALDE